MRRAHAGGDRVSGCWPSSWDGSGAGTSSSWPPSAGVFGFPDALAFILYTSVSGGILAIVTLGLTGKLGSGVRNVSSMLRPLVYEGTATVAPRTSVMLPYACAIALGAFCVVLSHSVAPFLRLRL